MTFEFLSPAEIAGPIKDQAVLTLGPWPRDLQLLVFVTKAEWGCGISPATHFSDARYRDSVLQIARELQKTIAAKQPI
jgi:hypothetical protein